MKTTRCTCVPAIDRHGNHYVQWIGVALRDCVWTIPQRLSVWLGLLNMLVWGVATFPQIYTNCRRRNADGLDFRFALLWLLADACAAAGSVLTDQTPIMRVTSLWFTSMDIILVLQYVIFETTSQGKLEDDTTSELLAHDALLDGAYADSLQSSTTLDAQNGDNSSGKSEEAEGCSAVRCQTVESRRGATIISMVVVAALVLSTFMPASTPTSGGASGSSNSSTTGDANICNSERKLSEFTVMLGNVLCWVSNLTYVFARIPQIWKNFKRGSVEGLSILMFLLGLTANAAYGLSVMLRVSSIDASFWSSTFPYVLSVALTTGTDAFIVAQSCYFKKNNLKELGRG